MKIGKIIIAVLAAALLSLSACSRTSSITSVFELEGKRIGVRGGTTSETWAKANFTRAAITTYFAIEDATIDLQRGVIDAIIVDDVVGRELVAKQSGIQILTDVNSFSYEAYGFAVRPGATDILNTINDAIQRVRQTGEYDLLYASFIEPEDGNIVIPSLNIPAGNRTLRVGTDSTFPPFAWKNGDEVVGFDVSLAQLIGREYNANIEIVDLPFSNLIPSLSSGAIDIIAAAMTITPERQRTVRFSIPYFTTELVVIMRK